MDNVVPIGIAFPITRDRFGYFAKSFTSMDAARYNLENLLRTRKGEWPEEPEKGSDLYRIVFEHINDEIDDLIDNAINDAVNIWMPEIVINDVRVERSPELVDSYRVIIHISFSLRNISSEESELTLVFEEAT